jgi:hypothetical protein
MQKAIFYGASDDLIEVKGVKGEDEFGAYNGDDLIHGVFNLGGKMRIYAIYDGCWMFAVGQVDEEIPLPDWPIRIVQSRKVPYSVELQIDVPDDVKVFLEGKGE